METGPIGPVFSFRGESHVMMGETRNVPEVCLLYIPVMAENASELPLGFASTTGSDGTHSRQRDSKEQRHALSSTCVRLCIRAYRDREVTK